MRHLSSWLPASFPKKGLSSLYIILIISVIFVSYGLFFYLQYSIEKDTNTRLVQEQIHSQIESTKKISRHIGSDFDAITLALHGLANSAYLQQGDLSSEKVEKLMQEVYSRLNIFTVVDRLFILDKNNTATVFIVPEGQTEPYFGSDNISFEQLVNQTRATSMPTFTNGFKGLDDVYRVAVTFPIINRQTNEYIGSLAALIPTVRFFEHYGNVHDIENQYLVALDRTGTFLTHPIKQNIGMNFFDPDFQKFIKHNRDYINQIRQVLMLPSLTSTLSKSLGNDVQQEEVSRRQQVEEEQKQQQSQAGGGGVEGGQQQQNNEAQKWETQPSYAIYDYGIGERLSTGLPILAQMKPAYFIFLVTPTSEIYSQVDEVLLLERIGMFSLLAGTTVAIVLLMIFLLKWNRNLNKEVKRRTRELEDSNMQLADANKKLMIRDKIQEEFVNIAAHELRTPLQPIISYSKLALKNKIDKGEAMRGIDRHVDRLHKLATDLLAVSRIEGGSLPYRMEKVKLNDLIVDVANSFVNTISTTYGTSSATLNVNWDQDSKKGGDDNDKPHHYHATTGKGHSNKVTENISTLSEQEGRREEESQKLLEANKQLQPQRVDIRGREGREEGEPGEEQEQERDQEHEKEQEQERQRGNPEGLQMQQPQLSIDVDLDPEIKEITVDKDRISQVLSNIIDNSIKFTTNKGCCIRIQSKLWTDSISETNKVRNDIHTYDNNNSSNNKIDYDKKGCSNKVNIKISDNGGGIPEDILPRLFEKFATKGRKGKENRQGTGLGLFITKSIITAHNGVIKAYNNNTGGATFSITLPAK